MPRNNLDLLRSIAVLSVFFSHCSNVILGHRTDLEWHFGQLGVLIFFVHTCLVLMGSMDRLGETGLIGRFYLRRAARIYPLAIFCVTVSFLLCRFGLSPDAFTWHELVGNLTLSQNLFYQRDMVAALWSLPLEVQMYIVLPFAFFLLRNKSRWWAIGVWAVSVPVAVAQLRTIGRLSVLSYAPCFLGGVIAWRTLRTSRMRKLPAALWPLGIAVASSVWMVAGRENNMWFRWLLGLALGLMIPLFRDIKSPWIATPAKKVADYSYGIYLTHANLLRIWFHGVHAHRWIQITGFAVSAVLVPLALYHAIEFPIMEWGKRVTEPPDQVISAPDRPALKAFAAGAS